MAYLLAWLGFNGRQLDDRVWRHLVSRVRQRVPLPTQGMENELHVGGARVYAVKVRKLEPEPLRQLADGRILLTDSRFEPHPLAAEVPSDEPTAVVVLDPMRSTIRLLRDRLGQTPLLWARVTDGLLVASKESILLGLPEISRAYDDEFLATHFAHVNAPPGRSLYAQMHVVEPGTRVDLDCTSARTSRTPIEPDVDAYSLPDQPAIARLRELLEASVRRNCEGVGRLGVALSSGLDSSSIAALLPDSFRGERTEAVGFGTDFNGSFDERAMAGRLAEQIGIRWTSFNTAAYPPSFDAFEFVADPGYPFVNPFRRLTVALYRSFHELGVDVYLSGQYADFWSPGPSNWLRDALRNRRWDVIARCYHAIWTGHGMRGLWREKGWRGLAAQILGVARQRTGIFPLRRQWTAFIADSIAQERHRFSSWPHPERVAYNLGIFATVDTSYLGHYRDAFGLQARYPFRTLELLRYLLSLPAYQGVRTLQDKWIARAAVADLLPEEWNSPLKRGGVTPIYDHFFRSSGMEQMRDAIRSSQKVWDSFIDAGLIERALASTNFSNNQQLMLLLRLAGFGTWLGEQEA